MILLQLQADRRFFIIEIVSQSRAIDLISSKDRNFISTQCSYVMSETVTCSENLVSEIISQRGEVTIEAVAESMRDLIQ